MKKQTNIFFPFFLLLTIAILVAIPSPFHAAVNSPPVASASDNTTFWVILRDKADLRSAHNMKDKKLRGDFVIQQLKTTASKSQAGLHGFLQGRGIEHRSFWIANAIKVTANKTLIKELEARPEVAKIIPDGVYQIPTPIKGSVQSSVNGVEWNIDRIRASEVWSRLGIRGENIVIANIDTGVQFDHPALAAQYRGNLGGGSYDHNYNWFDPSSVCGFPSLAPCDNAGHGTHTMGTMVGNDPAGNQIGVAPGAKWIAAKGCEDFSCSFTALISAGEWILAPTDLNGLNPRSDLRPDIVNNSWGGGSGDSFYQFIVDAWTASGIFPAFSNGNSGPGCFSSGSPGDYTASYSAGAFDFFGSIAFFSSRGPSLFGDIKPNISAPGVDVRSSFPGNSYASFSGTSMASPHVAGTVALMWSAGSHDIGNTRALLDQGAVDVNDLSCGGTIPDNNVWGEGRLDAYTTVLSALGPTGTLQGNVTGNGSPIGNAKIQVTQPGTPTRNTSTDGAGAYSFILPVGAYDVTVSAFGFLPQTATVVINQNVPITQDFTLAVAPSHQVSGIVRDNNGTPVNKATVTLLGTPIPPVITGVDGSYSFSSVPDGVYDVQAKAGGCNDPQQQSLTVDTNKTLDFTLPQRSDAFGYTCQAADFSYIPVSNDLGLFGDDTAIQIMQLPFPFSFYGQTYNTAFVSTNGFLNFRDWSASLGPRLIPDPNIPNAAIYPFWDDLYVDAGNASVRTELLGQAPNRQFVIEWNNVAFCCISAERVGFEVILYENGRILTQYTGIDANDREKGNSATVGIENETGTIGLQYSNNEPVITDGLAVLYVPPPSGFVQGRVTDANDGQGIADVTVRALQNGNQVRVAKTDATGSYRMQVPLGQYTVEAKATSPHYTIESASVVVGQVDQVITQNFTLRSAKAVLTPAATLEFIIEEGQTLPQTKTLSLSNTGSLPLNWVLHESGGAKISISSTLGLPKNAGYSSNARTTQGLYVGGTPSGWTPTAIGDVLHSWIPVGVGLPWGVGYTSNVWLSDPLPGGNLCGSSGQCRNTEFNVSGLSTGRSWLTSWLADWNADMAYDAGRNHVCQLAVGGDNGIHCWNPNTGVETASIAGAFPWTGISQRGLAYRPDDDSFYVGGWNEGVIYHINGLSSPNPGQVISQCNPPDGSISGLAWNSIFSVLWEATNSPSDTIYQLKPENNCEVVDTLAHPNPFFNGAGIEGDSDGNLWMVSQGARTVYLVENSTSFTDVPWLSESPLSGIIVPGGKQDIQVTMSNTAALKPGVYQADFYLESNSARQPVVKVPVRLVVTRYTRAVNAGGKAYKDSVGTQWLADQQYTAGSWGYVNKSRSVSTTKTISGTTDQPLYQVQRSDILEYRFVLPAPGTYEVVLGFAELGPMQPGKRVFDVLLEGGIAIYAHDIALDVGSFTADKHSFFVPVTDGQLNVRFVPRKTGTQAIINALRVTHMPDN